MSHRMFNRELMTRKDFNVIITHLKADYQWTLSQYLQTQVQEELARMGGVISIGITPNLNGLTNLLVDCEDLFNSEIPVRFLELNGADLGSTRLVLLPRLESESLLRQPEVRMLSHLLTYRMFVREEFTPWGRARLVLSRKQLSVNAANAGILRTAAFESLWS